MATMQPPNPPPVIRAPKTPGVADDSIDGCVHLRSRHIKIIAQTGVSLGDDPASLDVIADAERSGEVADTLILVDDVAGAASSDVLGDAPDVVERRQSERPDLVLGASALGDTVGVLGSLRGCDER